MQSKLLFAGASIFAALLMTGCGTGTGSESAAEQGSNNSGNNSVNAPPAQDTLAEQPAPANSDSVDFDSPDSERHHFYFSYDDSASTAGMELTRYYLASNQLPPVSFVRPHEFLNFETFDASNQVQGETFGVSMAAWEREPITDDLEATPVIEIGTYVTSPVQTKENRMNLVLTLLVDVSGSMDGISAPNAPEATDTTKMALTKDALGVLADYALKIGDTVNLVRFSNQSDEDDVLLEGWTYTGDNLGELKTEIDKIRADGGTSLSAGIGNAYAVANRTFDADKTNRVIIVTDAYANRGQVDPTIIAENTAQNNAEGIFFSGIGVGSEFNEAFLDELTEQGRGVYMSLVTPSDAVRVFDDKFISLTQIAARNVEFRLEYPKSLDHIGSAAEEISEDRSQVQPTNFSVNSSQYFLETFTRYDELNDDDVVTLTVLYKDLDGEEQIEQFDFTLGELFAANRHNLTDAFIIRSFAEITNGTMTCPQFFDIRNNYLVGYDSRIWQEYLPLIETYYALAEPGVVD